MSFFRSIALVFVMSQNLVFQGHLFLICGYSGAGKSTICADILKSNKSFKRIITYTTRLPREGEYDGVDYNFVSQEKFLDIKKSEGFLEDVFYSGNYYGTPASLKSELDSGVNCLMIVTIAGAYSLKKIFHENCSTVFIYTNDVNTSNERISARTDKSLLEKRITSNLADCDFVKRDPTFFDSMICNDSSVGDAVKNLATFIHTKTNQPVFLHYQPLPPKGDS